MQRSSRPPCFGGAKILEPSEEKSQRSERAHSHSASKRVELDPAFGFSQALEKLIISA